jgi:hypothetical protein
MNFNLKTSEIYEAVKREFFPIFRFSEFFKNLFLFLFILSIALFVLSILDFIPVYSVFKIAVLFFSLYLWFWNVFLFTKFKIKNPYLELNINEAVLNPENYNLAEFLDFELAKIVSEAINFCKKKKIIIDSSALLYSAIKNSKDTVLVCYRLGIDPKKLSVDAKNYLEKYQRSENPEVFSENFVKTILESLNITSQRNKEKIGEKEILVALAKHDDFFKKVLIEFDLKKEDVENLTQWLDSAQLAIERGKKFWSKENLARQGSMGKDWASGYTVTLDEFSIDWRKIVSKWSFKEIVGHEKEIESAETILARSNLANVLIVGEPGAGRKSIVEALAQKCYLAKSLP